MTGQVFSIDRTAPTVTAVVPTENANNAAIGTNVDATFSEDMNASTITTGPSSGTFTLRQGGSSGTIVGSGLAYNASTKTATLNPGSNLLNNQQYTAVLTNGIRDPAGNALVAKTWSFTTAPACTAPSVTTQPSNQSITYGADANFSVAVSGTSPTTVQWQKSADGTNWTNVSTGTSLTVTKPPVSDSGNKYRAVVTNSCGSATSNPATLTVGQKELTGSFTASNKVYDGNTSATVDTRSLPGVISPDTVNLDVTNAQFDNKNVGNGKTVSADLALSGAQAGNYSLSSNTATTTADITAKELTGSFTANNKIYDGTTAATITGRSVSGKVGSDDVSLSGGSATFGTASAGTGKTVTATGFTLTGAAKDNYTLKAGPWTTTADINPAPLTVTADNKSKKLDDPNPTFTASYSGFVPGETQSVLGGTLNFATNVPNPEQVGTWNITPSGLTSSNYNITFKPGTLTITYKFDGFRPPVDNPGTGATPIFNSAKAGQAIPIKFSLSGNQGLDIIATGYPKVTSVNCTSSATVDPLEEYVAVTANGGLNYDAGANQYNYVWKTQSAYANKCFKFDLTLKDGTSHVAYFKFLK